ncbi:helix-turn-helix domain-containing protein [Actinomycetospora endophytica]|uniref:Helix-turn-helix domain-containing protein n=1 Tax=Actinomycetospora endophytica TaxID=2291215 RepID=A0ABS8PA07_9PSEU|nr:helix-turn-helix domain-containing protein [Actinomycetospora endophytica]MCD2195113.1 helix-turn-helix domain-containing protein [Actinomycetospora endophytica]
MPPDHRRAPPTDGADERRGSSDAAVLASAAAVLARAEARRLTGAARAARALHRELSAHPRAELAGAWARIEQAKGMLMTTGLHHEGDALSALFTAGLAGRRSIIDLAAALIEKVTAGEAVTSALEALSDAGTPSDTRPAAGSATEVGDAVARATAFIDANAVRDIGTAEIVAVTGIGARALQQAFRTQLGTTPSAYLRDARLAGAHHDLLLADSRSQTVAAVASRWHFEHHGRFADYYRRIYGRTPSATLRRPPGPERTRARGAAKRDPR